MKIRNTFSLVAIFLALLPVSVFAESSNIFEADIYPERQEFTWMDSSESKDVQKDLVVFDKQNRKQVPKVLADIKSIKYTKETEGLKVEFETWEELPEDPGMPVNFQVFIDSDGKKENNAPDGVFRAGCDTAVMILFGTRTKWHSQSWVYDAGLKKWQKSETFPKYTIGKKNFSIVIPKELLTEGVPLKIRGMSLTSDDAITAIDVAPGQGLPPVRK